MLDGSASSGAEGRLLVIYNPAAGWRRARRLNRALAVLAGQGAGIVVRTTGARGEARQFAATVDGGIRAVIAAGGDGTINEVADGLLSRADAPPLGILPLGSANVLAREIGLSMDPALAAASLLTATVAPVWPGLVNGRPFLQLLGIGFDARVVAALRPLTKRLLGRAAYITGSLQQILRGRPLGYRLTLDGAPATSASVVIAKGHYYGGSYVLAPQARLADPWFEVCLFESEGRLAALRYLVATGRGTLERLPDYRIVPAREIRIEGREPEPVQGDGEIVAQLPLTVTVAPRPLDLLVPRSPGGHLPATVMPSMRTVGASTP